MNELRQNPIYKAMGPLLGFLALAVYVATLTTCANPLDSAYYIVHLTGIEPRLSSENPILYLLARFISFLTPAGSLSITLNVFSALCSACSVFILFQIVSGFIYSIIEKNRVGETRALIASISAGSVSALTMLFLTHFWTISNKFHPAAFHILILLAGVRWFMLCLERGSRKGLVWFAFAYGIAIVEYAPLIPFLSLFAPYIIFWLWAREELDQGIIIKLSVAGAAGLSFYLLAAALFCSGPIFKLATDLNYFTVLWGMWVYQYHFLSRILPEFGWLIIVMITVVPFLVCLFLSRRALNEDPDKMLILMHIVITVIATASVFDMEFIRVPIERAYMYLVLPYVLTALSFGYLTAYWFLLPGGISADTESGFLIKIKKHLGSCLLIPFVAVLIVNPFANYSKSNGRPMSFVKDYCAAVVGSMADAKYLVIKGSIENNIQISAYELKKDIKVINIGRLSNDLYLKYVGSMFEQTLISRYAEIGIVPMLNEWILSDNGHVEKIAIFNVPNLWRALGFEPIPGKLVFRGAESIPAKNDLKSLFSDHVEFWEGSKDLHSLEFDDKCFTAQMLYDNCMRHMGLVANNLGVLMEDGELQEDAFEAYQKAREIDSNNISALLNQTLMIQRGYHTDEKDKVLADMKEFSQNETKRGVWSLNRLYGYVRHPDVFAMQGYVWALSGRPDMAISGLKRAKALVPEDARSRVGNLIANMHMQTGNISQSREAYEEVLSATPDDQAALMGMTRLALMRGDVDNAKVFLQRAEQAAVPARLRNMEWAILALSTGDSTRARVIVEDILSSEPESLTVLVLLADVLMAQGDSAEFDKCLKRMEGLKGGAVMALLIRGDNALKNGDHKLALKCFEKALVYMPTNVRLMQKLLFLDLRLNNKGNARRRAKRLLNINPDNFLANHVFGGLMIFERKYDIAEAAFRKSIKSRPTADAMNELAWTLLQQEKLDEAESVIRDALKITEKNYAVWDTLGEIMMARERLDDAGNAFQRSLLITREDARVIMHMAELYIKKGDKARASGLLDEVFPKIKLMPGAEQERLIELRKLVR